MNKGRWPSSPQVIHRLEGSFKQKIQREIYSSTFKASLTYVSFNKYQLCLKNVALVFGLVRFNEKFDTQRNLRLLIVDSI